MGKIFSIANLAFLVLASTAISNAAVALNFQTSGGYSTSETSFDKQSSAWASWSLGLNGGISTTVSGTKFSYGLSVNTGYKFDWNEDFEGANIKVTYSTSCGSNSLAIYTYDPEWGWSTGKSFNSDQVIPISYPETKVTFQAQGSSTRECNLTIKSIAIGKNNEAIVTNFTAISSSVMSDYKVTQPSGSQNGKIELTVPYKTNITSLTPSFTGLYKSFSPSTAQDFSKGPVTFTFTALNGISTAAYDVVINRLPPLTGSKLTAADSSCATNFATTRFCADSIRIEQPAENQDTGAVYIYHYDQIPEDILATFSLSTKVSAEASISISESGTINLQKDAEPQVITVTAQDSIHKSYYHVIPVPVPADNYLYNVELTNNYESEFIYARTVWDPETSADTGKVIIDLPYKINIKNYHVQRWFTSPNSKATVNATFVANSNYGGTIEISKGYDTKIYAIEFVPREKPWSTSEVVGAFAYLPDNEYKAAIACIRDKSDTTLFTLPMKRNNDIAVPILATKDPYAPFKNVGDFSYTLGAKNTLRVYAEDSTNSRKIFVSITSKKEDSVATLRDFYIVLGNAWYIPGEINQEERTVQVNIPVEVNMAKLYYMYAGAENATGSVKNFEPGDFTKPFVFDMISADLSDTITYTVNAAYVPDTTKDSVPETPKDSISTAIQNIVSENAFLMQNNILHIALQPSELQSVSILNSIGQVVLHKDSYIKEIDMGNLPTGTYFVKIKTRHYGALTKQVKIK